MKFIAILPFILATLSTFVAAAPAPANVAEPLVHRPAGVAERDPEAVNVAEPLVHRPAGVAEPFIQPKLGVNERAAAEDVAEPLVPPIIYH
ncbi:hypothetical protein HDU76_000571 [Blyttiomyces sp. JEL0837]|nr:hypothetical protein HDU76_000571 [Blyttiomyces sp. JEL0837]